MTASTAAYTLIRTKPCAMESYVNPSLLWGAGTPNGDLEPFISASKGTIYVQADETDELSPLWVKMDNGDDDDDWGRVLTGMGTSSDAVALTLSADINLWEQNVTLTPGGTDLEFKLMRQQITTGGADADSYVKIGYHRIDLDHKVRTVYLWQGRLDIGASGDLAEAGYGQSLSITMANTGALDSDLFGYYVITSGSGAGGVTGNFVLYQGVANSTETVDAVFGASAAASGTATSGLKFTGEGGITNALYVNMGSTGITHFVKFEVADAKHALVVSDNAISGNASHAIRIDIAGTDHYLAVWDNSSFT